MDARVRIGTLRAQYLIPSAHPAPEKLAARCTASANRDLRGVLARVVGAALAEARPGVWLMQRLEIAFDADFSGDSQSVVAAWASAIVRGLQVTLSRGTAADAVLWFPSRAALTARFVSDVAEGRATGQWYYRAFAGLEALPVSAAIRTALVSGEQTAREILSALSAPERERTVAALTRQDCRTVVAAIAAPAEVVATQGSEARAAAAVLAAWDPLWTGHVGDDEDRLQLLILANASAAAPAVDGGLLVAFSAALACMLIRFRALAAAERATLIDALERADVGAAVRVTGSGGAAAVTYWARAEGALAALASRLAPSAGAPGVAGGDATIRRTRFGGLFFLLPHLLKLPLDEATRDWPALAGEPNLSAVATVRLLIMARAVGSARAVDLLGDEVACATLGFTRPPELASLAVWAAGIDRSQRRAFAVALREGLRRSGAVDDESWFLVPAPDLTSDAPSHTRWVLIDGTCGQWLTIIGSGRHRSSQRRAWALAQALRGAAPLEEGRLPARLFVDGAVLEDLREPLRHLHVPVAGVESVAASPPSAAEPGAAVRARLGRLPDDLAFLAFPRTLQLPHALADTLALAAQALLRSFAWRLPGFAHASLAHLHRNFLDVAASVEDEPHRHVVRIERPPLRLVLASTGLGRTAVHFPGQQKPFEFFPADASEA